MAVTSIGIASANNLFGKLKSCVICKPHAAEISTTAEHYLNDMLQPVVEMLAESVYDLASKARAARLSVEVTSDAVGSPKLSAQSSSMSSYR